MFTVMTPGSADGAGSRVGELDEEMVYESRVGDTFLLGSTSWKIVDITHDRVSALPVPGDPERMPSCTRRRSISGGTATCRGAP